MSVANAHPGLLAERGVEVRHGALENAARRTTQSRIVLVSHLRKRCRRGFAEDSARASNDIVVPRFRPELERECRVVVLGEQSEKNPASEHEWRRLTTPAVLGKAPNCWNRSDAGEIGGVSSGKRKNRLTPHPVARLGDSELNGRPMRIREPVELWRRRLRGTRDLGHCTVLNRR